MRWSSRDASTRKYYTWVHGREGCGCVCVCGGGSLFTLTLKAHAAGNCSPICGPKFHVVVSNRESFNP